MCSVNKFSIGGTHEVWFEILRWLFLTFNCKVYFRLAAVVCYALYIQSTESKMNLANVESTVGWKAGRFAVLQLLITVKLYYIRLFMDRKRFEVCAIIAHLRKAHPLQFCEIS
jgi:hypothetical protein